VTADVVTFKRPAAERQTTTAVSWSREGPTRSTCLRCACSGSRTYLPGGGDGNRRGRRDGALWLGVSTIG